jgi:ribosomal protein S18 acetylase RimI-like enzyme
METRSICRVLEWDSAFFGVRIATAGDEPLSSAEIDGALTSCREQSIDCLYLLVGAGDLATLRAAADRGFRLVDVRMTLDIELTKTRSTPHSAPLSTPIRPARESDIPTLRAIAAVSHTDSRFYADGRFSRTSCDELYATWIEKSCRGWADLVLVAEHESALGGAPGGAPAAYLSCHAREGHGEIGLVGVDARAQGRGLGRALVHSALRWFAERGLTRVIVVTQGRNVAAQRLYQSAGFRTSAVALWHHRWFDRDDSARS